MLSGNLSYDNNSLNKIEKGSALWHQGELKCVIKTESTLLD